MGSINDWHTIRTAHATEELAAHARADELRRRGLIGPTDGVAEARAHDQRVRDANRSTAANVLPGVAFILGGVLFVIVAVMFWVSSVS